MVRDDRSGRDLWSTHDGQTVPGDEEIWVSELFNCSCQLRRQVLFDSGASDVSYPWPQQRTRHPPSWPRWIRPVLLDVGEPRLRDSSRGR